jgi:hypothetical protein
MISDSIPAALPALNRIGLRRLDEAIDAGLAAWKARLGNVRHLQAVEEKRDVARALSGHGQGGAWHA